MSNHKSSIKFAYRCFDRILLNGLIQPFQRVIGFFNAYRDGERVTRNLLRNIAPAISELGQEPLREMGCAHPGCTRRVGVMKAGQDRRGGGDYQSHGTGPDHDRDRYR